MNLRNKSQFYTLFTPRMMSNRQLPTYLDILQHYISDWSTTKRRKNADD